MTTLKSAQAHSSYVSSPPLSAPSAGLEANGSWALKNQALFPPSGMWKPLLHWNVFCFFFFFF